MTPGEVHRHVCAAFDEFERRRIEGVGPTHWGPLRADLVDWVRRVSPAIAFAGLVELLESESRYAYQDIAGEMLDKADIACQLSLEAFMRRVLPRWDLSAGTVARYVARVFGREQVLALMRELKESGVTWVGPGTLDGVRYHLGEHPGND